MVLTRSRANSATRVTQQPAELYSAPGEQVLDGAMPSTTDGGALFVDVRSSTPPLAGRPASAGASAPSPPPLYGRELPGYSGMPQYGHAPPVASPQPPMPTPVVMTDQQLVFLLQALRSQPAQGAPLPPPVSALFVDVRSSTPPLAGRPASAGASAPSPPPLYGRELPGYSGMPQYGHAPPVASPQPPMPTPVVMTDQQLVFLLQALRSQPAQGAPLPPPVSTNLSNCSARYNGSGDVRAFTDSVQIYKDCVGVTDEIALRGLPMLLTDFAATWWQGVRHSVATWQEAIHLLRQTFGPRLPPHRIYREIFSREQGEERTDIFVCRIRALIAQLPPHTLPENPVQLDMVYGLLSRRIRERVARNSFSSFSELLQHARSVEDVLDEVQAPAPARRAPPASAAPMPPLVQPSTSSYAPAVKLFDNAPQVRARPRCSYCKMFGHLKEECRKLLNKSNSTPEPVKSEPAAAAQPELRPSVTCFGCGAPGVIRSNCSVCKEKRSESTTAPSTFQSLSTCDTVFKPRVRPLFNIEVFGVKGTALLDTGSIQSVASISLTKHLRANGQVFNCVETRLKFADGTQRVQIVETASVIVKVQGVAIRTLFIVLPGATESLLGMNFIQDAGMVLDFARNRFTLREVGSYDLQYECEDRELVSLAIVPRESKGVTLPSADSSSLAAPRKKKNTFSAGGGLTPSAQHRVDIGNAEPNSTPYRRNPSKKEKYVPHIRHYAKQSYSNQLAPRREGSFSEVNVVSPTKFVDDDHKSRDQCHASVLSPHVRELDVVKARKKGRRKKSVPKPAPEIPLTWRGRM
uniref:CCHC-type domain-containing protein n=1 Tax=Heliothis virescens TaxID=7102 RepID=A0A2A4IY04_HELVI